MPGDQFEAQSASSNFDFSSTFDQIKAPRKTLDVADRAQYQNSER